MIVSKLCKNSAQPHISDRRLSLGRMRVTHNLRRQTAAGRGKKRGKTFTTSPFVSAKKTMLRVGRKFPLRKRSRWCNDFLSLSNSDDAFSISSQGRRSLRNAVCEGWQNGHISYPATRRRLSLLTCDSHLHLSTLPRSVISLSFLWSPIPRSSFSLLSFFASSVLTLFGFPSSCSFNSAVSHFPHVVSFRCPCCFLL